MDQDINRILEIGSSSGAPAIGEAGASPEKIGGWLFFPAVGLILGGIVSVIGLVYGLSIVSKVLSKFQGVYTLHILFSIGILALLIYAAILFFGKKRNAPSIMIALMIANIAVSGLMLVIDYGADAEPLAIESGKDLLKAIVGAAIWIPYFRVSERVKRTFIIP
jgi:hypothetical protein